MAKKRKKRKVVAKSVWRYALFRGEHYYPKGGWDDLHGLYRTIDAAKKALRKRLRPDEWYQIVDLHLDDVVETKG